MSYREDLDAARARADALEEELTRTKRQLEERFEQAIDRAAMKVLFRKS